MTTAWRTVSRTTRTCGPFISVFAFALLLTFIFVLYQPSEGPGRSIQRIGWQSWDVIGEQPKADTLGPLPVDPGGTGTTNSTLPPGVDWWDVEKPAETTSPSTLPLDVWAPLLPHDTGITDIVSMLLRTTSHIQYYLQAIARCVIPPEMTTVCSPPTTPEEDALKGPWVRIPRDLNRKDGLWYLNLYYRRTRRLDIPLIVEIQLLPKDAIPANSPDENWRKADVSARNGVMRQPPLYLWYKLGPPLQELSQSDKQDLITELDVLYGTDRPWYGFEKVNSAINDGQKGKVDPVWLTIRRGVKEPPRAPPLHFHRNGTFKIMQIADLHFSVSKGQCRDTDLSPCNGGDVVTESLLSRVLDAERPDFVAFTGDQLNGQGTSWDSRSVISKFAGEVVDRKIPWAAIFGNHDDENDLSRADQMKLLEWLPYSVSKAGPSDVDGIGNYVLKVLSADASRTHLLTLYLLDSHAYERKKLPGPLAYIDPVDYDHIKTSQINWFLSESASINQIIRPFEPDGTKDLDSLWKRQSGTEGPFAQKLAKPNALAFFHIPLPEAYEKADLDLIDHKPLDFGRRLDGKGASKTNGHFLERAIFKSMESEEGASSRVPEVKVIGNGHCHASDNCRRISGVWMCFGGGGSYSGYGRRGFDRRFRIYSISDYGETIRTYKRTEKDEIVDDMILSGRGAPVL